MKRGTILTSMVLPTAIVIVGFAAVIFLTGWIEQRRPPLPEGYEDSDLTVRGSRMKGFAFGAEGLIADWYFMRALQYIGKKMLEHADMDIDLGDLRPLNPRLLYPLLQNATDLDPHFVAAYSYGAIVMPAIDSQQAIDFARKGVANNPDSFRLYQYLGYIYWKLGRFEEAADTYEQGSKVPNAPPFMRLMAAAMKTQGGSRQTARAIYTEMLDTSDEQVRITAQRRLMELDAFDQQEAIDHALRQFQERNGRCPNTFSELLQTFGASPAKVPGLRVDRNNNFVDPSGAPFLLDTGACRTLLDPERTAVALH